MFGVIIDEGPNDWEIFQHKDGRASIELSGTYIVPEAAIVQGLQWTRPIYRILQEENHEIIIDWTIMDDIVQGNNWSGHWKTEIHLEKGGLYLIETGLDTKAISKDLQWIFRGDTCRHIGVGNVFIIAGQSNASGYGRDGAYDSPKLGVHFFRNNDTWDIASHPLNDGTGGFSKSQNIEMGISGSSPYLSFAKSFMNLSHAPVGLIPTALGGSPIRRWVKEELGDLYENLILRLEHLGKGHGKYAGLLWYQGCSDAIPEEADQYSQRFEAFINDIRRDIQADLPVFTFQLNRELESIHDKAWGQIREAQRRAGNELPGVYILPTHDSSLCDGIHNNSSANIRLGQRLAKQCWSALLGERLYNAPQPYKLKRISDWQMKISFKNCPYGLKLFDSPNKANGFSISDCGYDIPIERMEILGDNLNTICLYTQKKVSDKAKLSYCWQANPPYPVIAEKSNYLPIISFYEFEICKG